MATTYSLRRMALGLGRKSFTASKSTRLPAVPSTVSGSSIIHNHFETPLLPSRYTTLQPSASSLVRLATTITRETEKFHRYLKDNGIEEPSFDVNSAVAFPKLPEDMRRSRENIIMATQELGDLMTGAEEGLRWLALDVWISPPSSSQRVTN